MKNKKNGLILGGVAIVSAVISSGITLLVHSKYYCNSVYNYAADLAAEGKYKKALEEFDRIGDYKNSSKYARICKEKIAIQQVQDMIDDKDYQSAAWMFDSLCDQNILSQRDKDYIHTQLLKLSDALDEIDEKCTFEDEEYKKAMEYGEIM